MEWQRSAQEKRERNVKNRALILSQRGKASDMKKTLETSLSLGGGHFRSPWKKFQYLLY